MSVTESRSCVWCISDLQGQQGKRVRITLLDKPEPWAVRSTAVNEGTAEEGRRHRRYKRTECRFPLRQEGTGKGAIQKQA